MARLIIQNRDAAETLRALTLDAAANAFLAEYLTRPLNGFDALNLASLASGLNQARHRTIWPVTITALTKGLEPLVRGLLEFCHRLEFPGDGRVETAIEASTYFNARVEADEDDGKRPATIEDLMAAKEKKGEVFGFQTTSGDEAA